MAEHPGDRDCPSFDTQPQAQRFFKNHGGSRSNNVDRLDADGDGRACETLPGGGGGDNGPGDDDSRDPGEEDDGGLPETATFGMNPVSGLPLFLTALGLGTFGLMLRLAPRLTAADSRRALDSVAEPPLFLLHPTESLAHVRTQ